MPAAPADPTDYTTRRHEPAGFPIVGGNTDIGFLFGLAGTLSRFDQGARPYFWNMGLVLSASVKNGPSGTELAQQNYVFQMDIVHLFGGRLRLNPAAFYQRTVNQGYFGLGNASSADRPGALTPTEHARYFQFIQNEVHAHLAARVRIHRPFSVSLAGVYRYMGPEAYPGSRLALDAATVTANMQPLIRGLRPMHYAEIAAGVVFDTRDSEVMPTRGLFHQGIVRFVQGFPSDAGINYLGLTLNLAQYLHLGGPFVFATRVLVDMQIGSPAFYDLYRGGTPWSVDLPGGGTGIRGVPSGRYLGPIKVVVNAELRALLAGFRLARQSFRIGSSVFADVGRVWSDYTFNSPLDGSGLGLKFGVGAGVYILWGQAALFRVEFAWSPDAAAQNPSFPVGIYVSQSVSF